MEGMHNNGLSKAAVLFLLIGASTQVLPHSAEAKGASIEASSEASSAREPASAVDEESRLAQVRELMGPRGKKQLRTASQVLASRKNILSWVKSSLSKKNLKLARRISNEIIAQSKEHEMDPVFLLAVIQTESHFNPKARGSAGEIGLMQLMPNTGEWIAKKIGLKWKGAKTLENPVYNIRIGAAYLSMLREKFDSHGRLYLAAYNMGARNVSKLRSNNAWPKDYPIAVMKNYLAYYERMRDELASSASKSALKPAS